ncbi:Gfo/Idh/MocA family oxidoreductase [Rubinisphaera sp.]|uniref:Gfo/Idh/MocA family protein n=1 Tax=Rubinisphaera sp. TaxID=2024857 RepID=UPI000C0C78F0|nr:Gfo/Idh/MocA family oxidoreductase [Rubinisphaera sp.]MBV08164.1 NAD-binding protein [Rubinisphaera sp.]HCS50783.1 NAD-binding protein [Planctomycetaceae bacterium]|tara:strand:+ start:5141 stop:6133 length:993 start_codon:yes stop_codon:yes gene_type:complete
MPDNVRWGILSTAKIGTKQVIPAMQKAANCEIVAISSRNQKNAQSTADELGIAKAYGSYEELLADPEIDAIYNPLPNHMHVDWSIAALKAGKHVLCEKPLGLTAADAQRLVDEAAQHPDLKVMEAFMYRHHPQWQKAKEIVDSSTLGQLCTIDCTFSYFNRDGGNIRNQKDLGGGSLMDIGCYPISLSRFIYGTEPNRVLGSIDIDPEYKIDRLASVVMEFPTGTSTFTCSTQMVPYQRVNIFGTEGRFEIEIPFNAPIDRPCKAWLQTASRTETLEFPVCSQYTIQGELFANAILKNTPVPTPLCDAIANMKTIEAIFASAEKYSWVSL